MWWAALNRTRLCRNFGYGLLHGNRRRAKPSRSWLTFFDLLYVAKSLMYFTRSVITCVVKSLKTNEKNKVHNHAVSVTTQYNHNYAL